MEQFLRQPSNLSKGNLVNNINNMKQKPSTLAFELGPIQDYDQSVDNKDAKLQPIFDENGNMKIVSIDNITDDSKNERDTIFEEERKFQKKEVQPRNKGDFCESNMIGKIVFFDFIRMLYRAAKQSKNITHFPLKFVPFLGKNDKSQQDAQTLLNELLKQNKDINKIPGRKIFSIILTIYNFEFYSAIFCAILVILTKLINSLLINEIIDDLAKYIVYNDMGIENPDDNALNKIYGYMVIVIFSLIIYTYSMHQSNRFCYQLTIKMRTQFLQLIYEKISIMSSFQIKQANIGKLVNLASNDFNMIEFKMYPVIQFYCAWVSLILSTLLLLQRFGVHGLVVLAVTICGVFIQTIAATKYGKFAMKRSTYNDQRIKLCNEVIEGIRLIKMYTWEGEFVKLIKEIRTKELTQSLFLFIFQYSQNALNNMMGLVAVVVLMTVMVLDDKSDKITVGNVVSTLDLVNFLRFQLMLSSIGLIGYKECINIMERSKNIMGIKAITTKNIKESTPQFQADQAVFEKDIDSDVLCKVDDFTSYWTVYPEDNQELQNNYRKDTQHVLSNFHFQARKGELTAILGKVGSGKSTLLQVFLGEIPTIYGHFYQKGSVSYVEQEPYIFNGTVRDNIILSKEFNKERYEHVVNVCCLITDFKELQDADQTEIGERGVNLSGGQKARISLARAVYQDTDIYLLDDPLSAVDAKVGKLLYNNVIKGVLKDKCVLLNTHQIHFTQNADVIYIIQDGIVKSKGTFKEVEQDIMDLAGQMNAAALKKKNSAVVANVENQIQKEVYKAKVFDRNQKKLIKSEEDEVIKIGFKTYLKYFKNTGQFPMAILAVCQFGFDMYLYLEINDLFVEYAYKNGGDQKYDRAKMATMLAIYYVTQLLKYINISQLHMFSVREYQIQLIKSLFRGKVSFFDQTPSGNIINRFSNDTGLTDVPLFQYFCDSFEIFTFCVAILTKIGIINSWMFIGMFLQFVCLYSFFSQCKKVLTQTRILDINNKAPVYTFFSTTLGGILPLRIYNQIDTFKSIFRDLVDNSQRTSYFFWFLARGYGFTAQFISTLIGICIIVTVIVMAVHGSGEAKDVGLIIVYIMSVQDMVQWCLRQLINLEIAMGSLERINNYTINMPHENAYILSAQEEKLDAEQKFVTQGNIEFKNVSLRYREGTDLVLKNLNFSVKAGEKIGCVGRTGAGKSSLLQALFRMIEIDDYKDEKITGIYLDGQRIQDYGLKIVRNSMSIIPQIPFVFAESIKKNLDPLEEFNDNAIIDVLVQIGLYDTIKKLPKGIYTDMSNVSSVFSAGQKQLICLGRTILKKSKIIVLDEATANVDMQTDDFIQKTIKDKFSQSTIFTIAHRLNTIADYDKILVMDKGQLAEFDHPFKLMTLKDTDTDITNDNSIFAQMVKNTGKQNAKFIFDISRTQYFNKKNN